MELEIILKSIRCDLCNTLIMLYEGVPEDIIKIWLEPHEAHKDTLLYSGVIEAPIEFKGQEVSWSTMQNEEGEREQAPEQRGPKHRPS